MKLIIDADEKIVCKGFEQPLTEEERATLIRAIGNGKPYNPSDDAISREALLADFKERNIWSKDIVEAINNAPPVESAKPKGEWEVDLKTYDKQHRTVFYCCSICGHKENCIIEKTASEQNPFCKICGADMRKGGAENES